MSLVSQFVSHASTVFSAGSAPNLLASIPLDPSHPFYHPLHQALISVPESQLSGSSFVGQCSPVNKDVRETFASFVAAVLMFAKGGNERTGEEQAYGEFTRFQAVYSEANRLYGMSSSDGPHLHAFLNPLILILARSLVQKASTAASLSTVPARDARSSRSIKDTTRQTIERSFQVASSAATSNEWEDIVGREHVVGDVIWPLANILWRIYAERRLHQQSLELCKSITSLTPHEDKRLASRGRVIRQTDLSQSYYWRGRVFVILLEMRQAKFWLDKAMRMCPQGAWQQRRAILIRLIPINILLGTLPSQTLLQQYDLPEFAPLVHAYRTGNVVAWRNELETRKEWLRRRHVWLILYERGETLLWRNLFREALKAYYITNPDAPRGRCPTWIFVSAATRAFAGSREIEDGTIGLEDIISLISSLIDHGLILGFLSYSQSQLVMKGSADGFGGFPRISQVVPRAIAANT
ncbi:hypothetical protein EHS25_008361 [Saitozyma podzolica]|uniref:PCI domain-containing protein n=1 Tax=Saitozyma podzolica TaxID=1890683 RepID=A0A427YPC3_9TREE|nr:hypothetical protein EHS25_008361 [Saitozyma podzolica]